MPKYTWLFFLDACGIGEQLVARLRTNGHDVITVTPGPNFVHSDECAYSFYPGKHVHYEALFNALNSQGRLPTRVVHLWSVTHGDDMQSTDEILERGLYSLTALAQMQGSLVQDMCHLTIISNQVYDVLGEEALCPAKATIIGPCKVIPQEYTNIRCCNIDLVLPTSGKKSEQELVDLILAELLNPSDQKQIALRGSRRWMPVFEPLHLAPPQKLPARLREGGVYLITGGLGGIGLALAKHLAQTLHAKLVLLGRTGLPPRDTWDHFLATGDKNDPQVSRIRQVLALEELGSEVLVLAADVTDERAMSDAITQALETFGTLHGVFHAAGLPGNRLIQFDTPEAAEQILAPKVRGTFVLEHVLKNINLDFLVLFSSIASIIGGIGQVDYTAANAFLDSYARHHSREQNWVLAIDWSMWQWSTWDGDPAGYEGDIQTFIQTQRKHSGISFVEGMQALEYLLDRNISHVVVSAQDFPAFSALFSSSMHVGMSQLESHKKYNQKSYPRPLLDTSYSPPENDLERQIAAIWEELLGIEKVGVDDNFFDLGGNSLIGVDLIVALRKTFHQKILPAYVLYEHPSVGAMAQYIGEGSNTAVTEMSHDRGERRRANLRQRMHTTGWKK